MLVLLLVNAAGDAAQDALSCPATLVTLVTVIEHDAVPDVITRPETEMVCGIVSVAVPVQPEPESVATDAGSKRRLAGSVSTNAIPDCAGFPEPFAMVKTRLVIPPLMIVVGENNLLRVAPPGGAATVNVTLLLTDVSGNATSTCELLATLVMTVPAGVGCAIALLVENNQSATAKRRICSELRVTAREY